MKRKAGEENGAAATHTFVLLCTRNNRKNHSISTQAPKLNMSLIYFLFSKGPGKFNA
jgi:hypothetical protein